MQRTTRNSLLGLAATVVGVIAWRLASEQRIRDTTVGAGPLETIAEPVAAVTTPIAAVAQRTHDEVRDRFDQIAPVRSTIAGWPATAMLVLLAVAAVVLAVLAIDDPLDVRSGAFAIDAGACAIGAMGTFVAAARAPRT